MNNLAETVWYENPVIIGAIAGSGVFKFNAWIYKEMPLVSYRRDLQLVYTTPDFHGWSDRGETSFKRKECTLLIRSIDSLTLEESCKIPSIKEEAETELTLVSLTDRTMWLNINIKLNRLSALDFFYLLSIGIWTGSKEGVEVVE